MTASNRHTLTLPRFQSAGSTVGARGVSPSRRGSAVALALVCVTVVAGLAVAFLRISTSATSRQMAEVENLRAFYLAEAGLAESFQALRIGRTGQVGSETEPAAAGNGLLWVDAVETADGQVRLESTALVGTGRATLALVVEPIDIPLGFFSDEDLVVESVLMVDGFDSNVRTYPQELTAIFLRQQYAQDLADSVGEFTLTKQLGNNNSGSLRKISKAAKMSAEEAEALAEIWPDLVKAYEEGTLFPEVPTTPIDSGRIFESGLPDSDPNTSGVVPEANGNGNGNNNGNGNKNKKNGNEDSAPPENPDSPPSDANPSDAAPSDAAPSDADPSEPTPPAALPTQHTTDGGVLGSNGNVVFNLAADEPVSIYGDIVPGPSGTVQGTANININGETESRPITVELPAVDVPAIAMDVAKRHNDLLPLVISPGTSGHESIEVAPGAELILRGPATIVIGQLIVEPGATLTLDTRDGDVALFVTGGMDLQEGSITTTTTELPDETTVQVAGIASGVGGAPVKLESTAQFHGTIYAPETEVYVGSNFEVYGGIVARKLEIGPGARLHFDNAGFEGTPIPRLVSWQIVEIKNAAKNRSRNLFKALGLDRTAVPNLADAHDLSGVQLKLQYIALNGSTQTYVGPEGDFDWDLVKDIVAVSRDATRNRDPDAGEPDGPKDPKVSSGSSALRDQINDPNLTSSEVATVLLDKGKLSTSVLRALVERNPPMDSDDLYEVLMQNGPSKTGFPKAQGGGALSGSILLEVINNTPLESKELSWILEQNSPLDADVLQAAQDRDPPMRIPDLKAVERAQ